MPQKFSSGGDAVMLYQRRMLLLKTAPWRDVCHAATFCWMLVIFNEVYLTARRYGPVNIAAIHPLGAQEPWFIVSDELGSPKTFSEYHERFQIEEGFLGPPRGVPAAPSAHPSTASPRMLDRLLRHRDHFLDGF